MHAANHSSRKFTTDAICHVNDKTKDLDIADIIEDLQLEIPEIEDLSALVEDINGHIAGFIVRKLTVKTRNFCRHCANEIINNSPIFVSKLTARKNRKYLKNPSTDMVKLTRKCEQIFRQYKHLIHLPKLIDMLVTKVFLATAQDVFNSQKMQDHCSEHALFSEHKTKLIKLVARIYMELRSHHECRRLNQKDSYKRRTNTASTTIYYHE